MLFASAIIDYDYIMGLIASYTQQSPDEQRVSKNELVQLIASHSNLLDEQDDILEFIEQLSTVNGLTVQEVSESYQLFKIQKLQRELKQLATRFGIDLEALKGFTERTLDRTIFDADLFSELFYDLDLDWEERVQQEEALALELIPHLLKRAKGRKISGISAFLK